VGGQSFGHVSLAIPKGQVGIQKGAQAYFGSRHVDVDLGAEVGGGGQVSSVVVKQVH